MNEKFISGFKNPGSEFRGAPFWAWNGKLEEDELRRQIRIMRAMGLGGAFMHSRVGLATKYLEGEWFDCVNACIDESKKQGMRAWLYDEDRWPSGAAGGIVTKDPKYVRRFVFMQMLDDVKKFKWQQNTLAAFTGKIEGFNLFNLRQFLNGKKPARLSEGESLLVFSLEREGGSKWYNNAAYLDTLSHEAVKKFIKVTHEAYKKHCGEEFAKTVPGIFTDEPNHGIMMEENPQIWMMIPAGGVTCPWTAKLPQVFKKRYGYDILNHLPEIFFDVDGKEITPARWHYHDCVTHLFVDAFSRQIGEWCGKNNIDFTGHVLMEGTLSSQTAVVGSCMRFYEYMQAPGMDLLTERWREYDTAKQVASVARQFNRKWRLTETYGCTGWDFPWTGHKALGDWQAALGINLRCQHLAWYTMEGEAKRDYPACIFYQSPWWEYYSKVEDYFARIHYVMTQGKEIRDLLVIHPVESMWTMCKKGWGNNPEVQKYDKVLEDLRDSILAQNIDFDYGDEEMLSRLGKVVKQNGAPLLTIGEAQYKAVVVPPLKTIRKTTLALLKIFKESGGLVVFAGKPPEYVNALPSGDAAVFAQQCPSCAEKGESLPKLIAPICRRISITDDKNREIREKLHLLREDKDAFYLFVCNVGHDFAGGNLRLVNDPHHKDRKAAFPVVYIKGFADCEGSPFEMDPNTGECFKAPVKYTKDGWTIATSFPTLGSRLFVIPKRDVNIKFPFRKKYESTGKIKLVKDKFGILLSEANPLVLDAPRYKIGSGEWSGPLEILKTDQEVRSALGAPHRGGDMVQPWAQEINNNVKSIPVSLLYSFEAEHLPSGDIYLALENPERFTIFINGNRINPDAQSGWWVDKSLRKIPVAPAYMRLGRNEILMSCDYDESFSGLEIAYLLGNFGTKVIGNYLAKIVSEPKALKIGDWVNQGLSFYSGNVVYLNEAKVSLKKGERLFAVIPDYHGVGVRIFVNDKHAGTISWEPNETDITDFVDGEYVKIAIEVIGHRRNSHGPLHFNVALPEWTGPGEFMTTGDRWSDAYKLVTCGLMKMPYLETRVEK